MVPTSKQHASKTLSTGTAGSDDPRKIEAGPAGTSKDGVQGEGDYEAARRFNEAERKFVASGKVAAGARAAAPASEAERREMIAAEHEGKARAKEEDSALTKAWPDPAKSRVAGKDADGKPG